MVEPEQYENTGAGHGAIFNAALSRLTVPPSGLVDDYQKITIPSILEPFDLLTFPEAFLPACQLLSVLGFVARAGLPGCVHVGLRPSASEDRHLFSSAEIATLLDELKTVDDLNKADLDHFAAWLSEQGPNHYFNVGCLFGVDADKKIRICLHPKLVRSQSEFSALAEDHMEEANLLTVVTLRPTNRTFPTINIQPLLCSDALRLQTDRPGNKPLEALHEFAGLLSEEPPDHIDIVSVATCTVQKDVLVPKAEPYRTWHDEFRKTFIRAASDDGLARHHFAVFILSNFRMIPKSLTKMSPGGLSGAFVPMDPGDFAHQSKRLDFVAISQWGKPRSDALGAVQGANNRWSEPDDAATPWSGLSYIASLDAFSDGVTTPGARMFGFQFARLPRFVSRMQQPKLGLTNCVQTFVPTIERSMLSSSADEL